MKNLKTNNMEDNDHQYLEERYISLIAFLKEEHEKKQKLEALVRKCFKLTKLHRESENLFE